MKRNNFRSLLLSLIFATIFLSSCATTLHVNVTRPARLDLNGAKTIAVLPFDESKKNLFNYFFEGGKVKLENYFNYYAQITNVERRVISYIKDNIENEIMVSPYLTLVNSSKDFKKTLKYGGEIPADVFICGEIVSFKVTDKEIKDDSVIIDRDYEDEKESDLDDEELPPDLYSYTRQVQLVFNYDIVDGKTKNIIYHDSNEINEQSGSYDSMKDLPNIFDMISDDLEYFVSSFMKDIQPYQERKSITLLEDKSDNPFMKYADDLASEGNYRQSYDEFYKLYVETNQFEAGYNAAMLLMAMGDLKGSKDLMSEVYNKTGNEKALDALRDINRELKQADTLDNQLHSFN